MAKSKLTKSIETLIERAGSSPESGDAMRFSQAACNAANALFVITNPQIAELVDQD